MHYKTWPDKNCMEVEWEEVAFEERLRVGSTLETLGGKRLVFRI
jgi:hypothetical protein